MKKILLAGLLMAVSSSSMAQENVPSEGVKLAHKYCRANGDFAMNVVYGRQKLNMSQTDIIEMYKAAIGSPMNANRSMNKIVDRVYSGEFDDGRAVGHIIYDECMRGILPDYKVGMPGVPLW